jgi:stage V sporulation protein D (sporulation-specific penicillin-binding protein)
MLDLLQDCVLNGTGKTAKIRGYEVAGKTGSAQKVVNKRYSTSEYIASFASIVPADHPRIAILATVDAPKGIHWGAVVAAPIAREVARQAVIDLGIKNDPANTMDGAERRSWKHEAND